ncbi:MAG TPA: hypothetical protein VE863_11585 [Pyrinomonadaceae bacterium]|nr:hypothetical protein [Pyrinomonadaceae bacterium]
MPFKDDEEILDLVRRFESCEIHPADFRHYQHLTVALWYVRQFPYEVASEKMRIGIQQLAAAYGKTGYHETITLFWLIVVKNFLASDDVSGSICEAANQLAASCADKNLINEYYSEELLASPTAKRQWIEPDLKPLQMST